MIITDVKIYEVKPRWIFVRVDTDEGISGWGEMLALTRPRTVIACAKELGQRIIGKDPCNIEGIWEYLFKSFFRGGPIYGTVVSGIEIALWDIKGKKLGVPVHQLLGGKARDSVRVYSWVGGDRPSDVAKAAKERAEMGFTAVKMNATEELHYVDSYAKVKQVIDRVASIREALGDDFGIGIDFHGRVHKPMAKVLAHELEPLHPMFLEEVVLPEHQESFAEVASHTSIPLATGERLVSRWAFKDIFKAGVIDIIQPDVCLTGGIFEMKKIIAAAESFDMAAAPHAPYGPIALAATLQVDACCPNVFIQEQSLGIHYNKDYDLLDFVKNKEIFRYEGGFAKIPEGPGLGIDIDQDKVEAVAAETTESFLNPYWLNEDGTHAEW